MTNKHLLAILASVFTMTGLQAVAEVGAMLDDVEYHAAISDAAQDNLAPRVYATGGAVRLVSNAQKQIDDVTVKLRQARQDLSQVARDYENVSHPASKATLEGTVEEMKHKVKIRQAEHDFTAKTLNVSSIRPLN